MDSKNQTDDQRFLSGLQELLDLDRAEGDEADQLTQGDLEAIGVALRELDGWRTSPRSLRALSVLARIIRSVNNLLKDEEATDKMKKYETEDRATLQWKHGGGGNNPVFEMAFGYLNGEPTAAIFLEGSDVIVATIPRDIMIMAVADGWDIDDTEAARWEAGGLSK